MVKIAHLTSVHPRYDTRIFHKMCKSLTKKYDVFLIVADSKGDEIKDNIKIFDVGKAKNRLNRVFNKTKEVLKKAIEIDANIYHLHDPELIPMGLKLKKMGKKVIFDSHEDIPKQILNKPYFNQYAKILLSKTFKMYEKIVCKQFDYIIAATPYIRDKFLKINKNSVDVNNFPIVKDFLKLSPTFENNIFCYIGTLHKTRGIEEIVKAVEKVDAKLIVAGKFYDENFEKKIKDLKGWEKVDFRGLVGKNEILKILEKSIAGFVTLYPTLSYVEAYPVKMFEYMASGIGVISSNFPLYKELLEDGGVFVNPLDVDEIVRIMQFFIYNKEKAKELGIRGRKIVEEKYNWEIEEGKLFQAYEKLLIY